MIDSKGAAQAAFFEALSGSAAVTADSSVYQHVPENTQPQTGAGLVIIGDLSSEAIGGKDGGLDRVTVEVVTVIRDPAQTELTRRQAAVREALEESDLPEQEGAEISRPVFEGDDATLTEDGHTYIGTQRFSVFVQEGPEFGPEIVPDPEFEDGSQWELAGSGTAMASGELTLAGTLFETKSAIYGGEGNLALNGLGIEAGKSYCVRFTISARTAGSVFVMIGNTQGTVRSAVGSYSEYIAATDSGTTGPNGIRISGTGATNLKLTSISVKELVG